MKRAMPWSVEEDDSSSSSGSDTESRVGSGKSKSKNSSDKAKPVKRKSRAIDFEALKRHGYKGGLSVLGVPPPKEDDSKKDWSWSTGDKNVAKKEIEESFAERQETRAKLADAEQLANVQTRKEKNAVSFSQKEKRKRELGQASRGKNYVEEEKRLLRDNGVYSGFDS